MRVIGLAGWSGAGKTTLLVRLIPEFIHRNLAVSTVKHAHHAFDIDAPGKDSFEHRRAGAREVLISSSRRYALIGELREEPEPGLAPLLRRLAPADLVLVEGYKMFAHPKVEVHRRANGRPLLYRDVPNVRALASDVPLPDVPLPVVPLDDVPGVADAMIEASEPLEAVLALLEAAPEPGRLRAR
jgi:molybdopterin-guanine dinucleotide biosynthesis protein B